MISINISELIWTVINFFLLLFLLNRFLCCFYSIAFCTNR